MRLIVLTLLLSVVLLMPVAVSAAPGLQAVGCTQYVLPVGYGYAAVSYNYASRWAVAPLSGNSVILTITILSTGVQTVLQFDGDELVIPPLTAFSVYETGSEFGDDRFQLVFCVLAFAATPTPVPVVDIAVQSLELQQQQYYITVFAVLLGCGLLALLLLK